MGALVIVVPPVVRSVFVWQMKKNGGEGDGGGGASTVYSVEEVFLQAPRFAAKEKNAYDWGVVYLTFYTKVDGEVGKESLGHAKW